MEIIKPKTEVMAMTGHEELPFHYQPNPKILMEVAGRNCYKSETAVTKHSSQVFVERREREGHLTILEHSWEARLFFNIPECKLKFIAGNWSKYFYFSQYNPIIAGNFRAWKEAEDKINFPSEYSILPECEIRKLAKQNNEPFLMRATVRIICDRGVSHEVVRARTPVYSQECVSGDTIVKVHKKKKVTIRELHKRSIGSNTERHLNKVIYLRSCDENGNIIPNKIQEVFYKGIQEVFLVKTKLGYSLKCTKQHKFLTEKNQYLELEKLRIGDKIKVNGRPSLVNIPDEKIAKMYLIDKLCPQEISENYQIPFHSIVRKLKQIGIFKYRLNDKNKEKYNKNHTPESFEKMKRTILKQYEDGRKVWNKGLSEKENSSVKKQADSLRKNHHNNGFGKENSRYKNGIGSYKDIKLDILNCELCGCEFESKRKTHVHHKNQDRTDNSPNNLIKVCINCHFLLHRGWHIGKKAVNDEIISIEKIGPEDVYDIEMKSPYHNYVANGFITHNSTRWVNYLKKKIQFLVPPWVNKNNFNVFSIFSKKSRADLLWFIACWGSEHIYNALIELGWNPQQARSVLINSLKTEIVMSDTLEGFQHFFGQRILGLTGKPHPQMKEAIWPLYLEFMKLEPDFFTVDQIKKHFNKE